MKDFPMFTTEYGAASLVLKEIPYRQEAYITIRASQEPEKLVEECVSFCRVCGAEKIYAAGWDGLEKYPLHASILEMRAPAQPEPDKLERLFPVTEATIGRWREIYNGPMRDIDCAATLTSKDEQNILQPGGAYFVHRDGQLLGIGWMDDTELLSIVAAKPGAGERVMHTLMSLIEGAQMRLQVASTNERAIRFYRRLGFVTTKEAVRWYKII